MRAQGVTKATRGGALQISPNMSGKIIVHPVHGDQRCGRCDCLVDCKDFQLGINCPGCGRWIINEERTRYCGKAPAIVAIPSDTALLQAKIVKLNAAFDLQHRLIRQFDELDYKKKHTDDAEKMFEYKEKKREIKSKLVSSARKYVDRKLKVDMGFIEQFPSYGFRRDSQVSFVSTFAELPTPTKRDASPTRPNK